MAPPDFTGVTVEHLKEMARSRDWGFELTPQIEEITSAVFEVVEDNTVRARFSRQNHMAVIDAFWGHKPSALYAKVACPVLLMPTRRGAAQLSEERRLSMEKQLALAGRLLPVSETVWLEDSVHDVPLQRPELLAKVLGDRLHGGLFRPE